MSILSRPPEARRIEETIGDRYVLLDKIGKGSYGVVYRAKDTTAGEIVAIKVVGVEPSTKREIECLASISHPSIIHLKDLVTPGVSAAYLVLEYAEHDLKSLLDSIPHPFSETQARAIMSQLLRGVRHLHRNGYLHQDLKPSNLLITKNGDLKICDLGLCRRYYGSPVPYTETVGTLWYRAPELLRKDSEYSAAIDMWSVGCIMAEILGKDPLLTGPSREEQMEEIVEILGTPSEKLSQRRNRLHQVFQRFSLSSDCVDLLARLLAFEPKERITADDALSHPWFM